MAAPVSPGPPARQKKTRFRRHSAASNPIQAITGPPPAITNASPSVIRPISNCLASSSSYPLALALALRPRRHPPPFSCLAQLRQHPLLVSLSPALCASQLLPCPFSSLPFPSSRRLAPFPGPPESPYSRPPCLRQARRPLSHAVARDAQTRPSSRPPLQAAFETSSRPAASQPLSCWVEGTSRIVLSHLLLSLRPTAAATLPPSRVLRQSFRVKSGACDRHTAAAALLHTHPHTHTHDSAARWLGRRVAHSSALVRSLAPLLLILLLSPLPSPPTHASRSRSVMMLFAAPSCSATQSLTWLPVAGFSRGWSLPPSSCLTPQVRA